MALAEGSVQIAGPKEQVSIGKNTSLYPGLDIVKKTRGENSEESELIEQGDLKKLDDLKQLSKKILKDLEEVNKRGKEIEQKIKQKETDTMTLAEGIVQISRPKEQVSISIGKHTPLYPSSDIVKETRSEESELIEQGDLKKLDELKQLSKKIWKDLEEVNKRGKEIEQKIKQTKPPPPPKYCCYFSFKACAFIIGVISLVIFSIWLSLPFHEIIRYYRFAGSHHNKSDQLLQLLFILATQIPLPLLGIVAAYLLLFGIFVNRKGFFLSYLFLNTLLLNLYLILTLGAVDDKIQPLFVFISVFEAFALYTVFSFYKIMD